MRNQFLWLAVSISVATSACTTSNHTHVVSCTSDFECLNGWYCAPDSVCRRVPDAGNDGAVGADASVGCEGSPGCIVVRPEPSTSSSSDAVDATFALRDLLVTQSNQGPADAQPWRYIGFDLDGMNTATATDPNGCLVSQVDGFPRDGVGGIDNQFGAVLANTLLPIVAPNLQNDLCCMQARARGTVLLRVREWNGLADDAHVVLSLTTSYDGTSESASNVEYDARSVGSRINGYVHVGTTTPADRPAWIPDTDTWFTNLADLASNDIDRPRHVDVDAYVGGGYLVMALNATQPIHLYLGRENVGSIGLRGGRLVAHLSANHHLIDEGWIGGRMDHPSVDDFSVRLRANELYSSAARCTHDGSACPGDVADNDDACLGVSGVVTPLIGAVGDVLANGNNAAAQPCDAISVGLSFRGVRAAAVLAAVSSLAMAAPDCDGQSAVFGTPTLQENVDQCPLGASPSVCAIRGWNPAD